MVPRSAARAAGAAAAVVLPGAAAAHGFGRLYNLPVPFWLYGWAASAALVLSFVLVGIFAATPPSAEARERDVSHSRFARALRRALPLLRGAAVATLLLCIVTGFFGSRDPFHNFSMTFFWVVFALAFAWLAALLGDFYALLNPWRVIVERLARRWPRLASGRFRYPEALGDWPALALYLGFTWFELFGLGKPSPLARMLLAYTALNLAGAWAVGMRAWFAHCECFAVFFRLLGTMAPLQWRPAPGGGRLWLRPPMAGLLRDRPVHLSTVAFALAMLATTAFDGLRATQWWVNLFWQQPHGIGMTIAGGAPVLHYALLRPWYVTWETGWLLLAPFLYLAAYLVSLALAKGLTRTRRPLRELALDFGLTLLPIALVYHVTHYATLLLTQGLKIFSLLSDPFGWNWNLLGTAGLWRAPILPPMGSVWHSQVALILLGHVLSVVAAHRVALRVMPSRRTALLSQLPMLLLMMAFTVAGLWILAQPLTALRMR
ncbi:MAG TPA: hypothetical protein VM369_03695 [Candidatus Binatia bacterium]|nr:hypothetical protein [Candidatus Binatia bacterium]